MSIAASRGSFSLEGYIFLLRSAFAFPTRYYVFIGQEITAMLTSNDFDKLVVIVLFITVQFEPVPSPTCRTSP